MGALDGLNPEFTRRLLALQAAARAAGTDIGWGSGLRSPQEQAALRIKNGCPDVYNSPASSCRVPTAIPGRSNHNHGLAMDITGDKAWANANGARFGLHFPVSGEDWHVEMIDDDASHGFVDGAQQMGAIGFDVNWQQEQMTPEERMDQVLGGIMDSIAGAQNEELALIGTPQAPELGTAAAPEISAPGNPMENVQLPEPTQQLELQPQGAAAVAGGAGGGGWQGNVPPPGYVPPGEGVDRWRDVAIAALKYTGQDPGLVDVLLRRMGQESSGNPTAVNNWDSNAQRGDPSKGLMQNIGSAFPDRARELSGRGIFDGFANIVASIRYTLNRYGSLAAGYNRKGGY